MGQASRRAFYDPMNSIKALNAAQNTVDTTTIMHTVVDLILCCSTWKKRQLVMRQRYISC